MKHEVKLNIARKQRTLADDIEDWQAKQLAAISKKEEDEFQKRYWTQHREETTTGSITFESMLCYMKGAREAFKAQPNRFAVVGKTSIYTFVEKLGLDILDYDIKDGKLYLFGGQVIYYFTYTEDEVTVYAWHEKDEEEYREDLLKQLKDGMTKYMMEGL